MHYHLDTSMHVGTHMDGPLHMLLDGRKLSEIDVSRFIARGHLIDARSKSEIGIELLERLSINQGDCVLIYTGFSEKFREREFYSDYPDLTEEIANKLVELKVKFVGMDSPSPDKAPYNVHRILLKQEILIIEAMDNLVSLLAYDNFEVIALPTKYDAEAAPVRVIAMVP